MDDVAAGSSGSATGKSASGTCASIVPSGIVGSGRGANKSAETVSGNARASSEGSDVGGVGLTAAVTSAEAVGVEGVPWAKVGTI